MKTKKFLSMAALALVGAMTVSCSSDDNIIEQPQQPENKSNVVTLTTTVGIGGGAGTRALTAEGVKTFAAGETMAIVYKNMSGETAVAVSDALQDNGDITNEGKSATFTFTLDSPNKNENVTYVYPAAMVNSDGSVKDDALAEQDGTLSSLSSNLDYCTNSGAWDNGALPELTLDNQFAILAITLKNTDGSSDITDTFDGLTIEDGTNTYNVTRTKAAGPIYVAIRPTSAANIEVTAYDGPVFYPKSLTAKTYEASNGYSVSWKMTRGGIDLARIKSSITVTAQHGDVIKGTLKSGPTYRTKVEIADDATVTLSDASISNIGNAGLTCLGNATINLVGTNTLNTYSLGIFVPSEKTLTIDGSGSLTATGDNEAPGIGGNGNITINGGTITAHGGNNSAGIGSGSYGGVCGDITINGGTVNATGDYGAGIGSVYAGGCGSIIITGGNVTAKGGQGSAGIGSGQYQATCTSISITGGTVNATGGEYGGAGIGSGNGSSCAGGVTITTGVTSVTATAGTPSYGQPNPNSIGAGNFGTCGTVTIGGVVGVITESPFVYPAPAPSYTMAADAASGDVGKLICTAGHIHAYNADAECTATRVAKIIYLGTTGHSTYTHGLALALTDEASKMEWQDAINACSAKNTSTPVTNATWLLASKDQWNYMLGTNGAGSYTALRDGFSSVGGSNLQSDDSARYWSSTAFDSDEAWRIYFYNGIWNFDYKDDSRYVRACLAF